MEKSIEEFKSKNKKATLKDIASITGLSLSAVSQALNPSSRTTIGLSEKSIEKARSVAKQINYRTHWGAVSSRSNFLYNIAYIRLEDKVVREVSPFLPSFSKAAKEKNFAVTYLSIDNNTTALPNLFKHNRLDAIVIDATNSLPPRLEAELNSSNIPRVDINKRAEFNAIYTDEIHASNEMTNYLIERSHKDILFLKPSIHSYNHEHYSVLDREKGYIKAMKASNLTPAIKEVDASLAYNQRIDMSWLDFNNLPEAIIAYDDNVANAIAKAFYRRNINIPRQVSLAGFNGAMGALSAWCPLSTMGIPYSEMGEKAFEMVLKLIEKENKTMQKSITFKSSVIIGESTK